jgi:hypothetical protein
MYLKKPGIFLKLSNGWVDYVKNKREQLMGQPITQQDKQFVRRPDLYSLFNPNIKLAAEARAFAHDVAPLTKQAVSDAIDEYYQAIAKAVNIPKLLHKVSSEALKSVCQLLETSPGIYNRFEEWHGLETLTSAIATAEARERREKSAAFLKTEPTVKRANQVQIYYEVSEVPADATETELADFYDTGLLVRDDRMPEEKSTLVEMHQRELTQPSAAGYYDLMGADGKMEKALIVPIRIFKGDCSGKTPSMHMFLVNGRAQVRPTHELFVDNKHMADAAFDFAGVFGDLGNTALRRNGMFIAVSKDGQATVPFEVVRSFGEDINGAERYEIELKGDSVWGTSLTLVHGGKTKLRYNSDTLYVPEDTKFFPYSRSDSGSCCSILDDVGDEPTRTFVPANINDVWVYQRQGVSAVKVANASGRWLVDGSPVANKKAAVNWLVHKYRLDAKESLKIASDLESTARLRGSASKVVRYKLANSLVSDPTGIAGDITTSQESPNLMGFRGELAPSDEVVRQVPQQEPYADRNAAGASIFEDGMGQIKSYVQIAADRGDRDVFDVALMASMLKTVKDELVIDDDLPSLIVALDKLGRLLFKFYWHMDMFEERYGKQDMPELEDMLRNGFEVLSNIILFLKNKTTDPFADGGETSFALN